MNEREKPEIRPALEPRQQPRQRRSREIVDAVQQACMRILEEEGPDALTTNHIAEVAGVGIASLYRYFPNKESILGRVFEEQLALENQAHLERWQKNKELDPLSLREKIRVIVDVNADHHLRLLALAPDFYRSYLDHLDPTARERPDRPLNWKETAEIWLREVLEQHRDEHHANEFAGTAFMLTRALLGAIRSAVEERPELLEGESFRRDLVSMAMRAITEPD
ncbi:MAG: hypothetical protein CL933_10975 [Deltaproteobacteria bacterium]|nr:hypothetical protein [Deltaproteobacteria bacterium]